MNGTEWQLTLHIIWLGKCYEANVHWYNVGALSLNTILNYCLLPFGNNKNIRGSTSPRCLDCHSCLLSLISASAAPAVSDYLQISPTPQVCVAHTSHSVAPAILVYHKAVGTTGIRTHDTSRVISKSESFLPLSYDWS